MSIDSSQSTSSFLPPENLKAKRAGLRTSITCQCKQLKELFLEDLNNDDVIDALASRLSRLEKARHKLNEVHDLLEPLLQPDELEAEFVKIDDYDQLAAEITVKAKRLLAESKLVFSTINSTATRANDSTKIQQHQQEQLATTSGGLNQAIHIKNPEPVIQPGNHLNLPVDLTNDGGQAPSEKFVVNPQSTPSKPTVLIDGTAEPYPMQRGAGMKLPPLQIKPFNGELEQWESFINQFMHIIDQDQSMTAVQKMIYLQNLLTGQPRSMVGYYQLKEGNYHAALKKLTDKYGRSSAIKDRHITAITQLKVVTNIHNLNQLMELENVIDISLQALENLGVKTANLDDFLFSHVKEKIPDTIYFSFKRTNRGSRSLEELMSFFREEVAAIEERQHDQKPQLDDPTYRGGSGGGPGSVKI